LKEGTAGGTLNGNLSFFKRKKRKEGNQPDLIRKNFHEKRETIIEN